MQQIIRIKFQLLTTIQLIQNIVYMVLLTKEFFQIGFKKRILQSVCVIEIQITTVFQII